MRVVLDTCILKLATFPTENNASALIFELARTGLIEAWASPATIEECAAWESGFRVYDRHTDHPGNRAKTLFSQKVFQTERKATMRLFSQALKRR